MVQSNSTTLDSQELWVAVLNILTDRKDELLRGCNLWHRTIALGNVIDLIVRGTVVYISRNFNVIIAIFIL